MEQIIELARRLGEQIAQSPQAKALREIRDAMKKEKDLADLMKQYNQQAEKIAKLEHENKTIEVEDKHLLQSIQQKLFASDTFKKLTAAQVEYVDLMRKVNDALRTKLEETEK